MIKLEFLPQPSASRCMQALISLAQTKLILMTGQKLTAQQALQYGLIEWVIEPDLLMTKALDFVADIVAALVEITYA